MRLPRGLTRPTALLCLVAIALYHPAAGDRLRPPSVPLVTHDPYFSIWCPADRLTDADTVHWTGRPHRLASTVEVDGKSYSLLGKGASGTTPAEQTDLAVTPTRTVATFRTPGVQVTLTFTTPALPDDLDVLSRPVTYVTWSARSADGRGHRVGFRLEASADIAVNEPTQEVRATRADRPGLAAVSAGTVDQPVLARRGDDLRIDWGRLCLAVPRPGVARWSSLQGGVPSASPGDAGRARSARPPASQLWLSVAAGGLRVNSRPVSRWAMVAYDDEWSIRYFGTRLRPYWRRGGDGLDALLSKAARDYERLSRRCQAFDARLTADLRRVGGERYARLCALAYRQTLAGNKVAADANGMPLMFPKECFSNGCISTVDVLFPQAPFFLTLSPALTRAMLVPVLDYAESPRWPYPYAPHDLGTYPWATGQVYGMGGSDADRMPVEECGNMLLMLAALARAEGRGDLADRYWPMLTKWADYLVREGLDPRNQLCSADMFGHMPRNANLALKAVIGIGAYARLAAAAGRAAVARKYMATARDYAARWQRLAADEGHTRLAYDRPGTWSMKHNLIWDRVLGLGLLPASVGDAEVAWYLRAQGRYGLPVDSRTETCLIDWALWSIALARRPADFEALLAPIYRYADETPSRVPLSDWFVTTDARQRGFQARPVVGGLFIRMLADTTTWRKWSTAAESVRGRWAPLPAGGATSVVLPTAQTAPAAWRYTLSEPPAGWARPDFDDGSWQTGQGGFGTPGTPGAAIGTVWNTKAIWLRREFTLPRRPLRHPRLLLIYDEDPQVYVNGVPAASAKGWTTSYDEMEMSPLALKALRPGRNVLAVRASQTYGGQSIDAGIVEDAPPRR